MSIFDIALKIKAKNGVLQKFIDDKGWTQAEFARQINFNGVGVGKWFNMTDYPRTPEKMLEVAALVGALPEKIFPDMMRDKDWLTGQREWTMHKEIELEFLPFHHLIELSAPKDNHELKENINDALKTLTLQEREVIEKRMGLNGIDESTLEDIAQEFNVSKERIRQIESKALRKLRQPSRKKYLESSFQLF